MIALMSLLVMPFSALVAILVMVLTQRGEELDDSSLMLSFGSLFTACFFLSYGLLENSEMVQTENLLPLGLAEGCQLRRAVAQDTVLTYDDVIVPPNRLIDRLYAEQLAYFEPSKSLS